MSTGRTSSSLPRRLTTRSRSGKTNGTGPICNLASGAPPRAAPFLLLPQLYSGEVREVNNACEYPGPDDRVVECREPVVAASIISPAPFVGRIMELCQRRRGILQDNTALGGDRALLKYELPLAELASDFFSELKGLTSGYATLDYEDAGTREADLCKMDILLNGSPIGRRLVSTFTHNHPKHTLVQENAPCR